MPWITTNNKNSFLSLYCFTLFTNFFYRCSNFHDIKYRYSNKTRKDKDATNPSPDKVGGGIKSTISQFAIILIIFAKQSFPCPYHMG